MSSDGPPCAVCGQPQWGGEPPNAFGHLCATPPPKLGDVCQHGGLRRKCQICERDDEIASLKQRLAVAVGALEFALDPAEGWSHCNGLTRCGTCCRCRLRRALSEIQKDAPDVQK